MRFLKKILYIILGLLALLCGFVLICAYNPDVSEAVAGFLYPERNQAVTAGIDGVSETEPVVSAEETSEDGSTEQFVGGAEDFGREGIDTSDALSGEESRQGLEEDVASDYLPPDTSDLVIPENVSGRNGYQEIQEDLEQVDDEDARRLQRELDEGHTGDGLEFDEVYYPYYAMLNEKGQHVYRQIYANADALYPVFAPVEAVMPNELKNIFSAVVGDHPELFWLETAYSGKYTRSGQCVELDLKFNGTAQNLDSAKASFEENAQQIVSGAQALSDDYEKEKFVHDALIDKLSYNMGAEMNQSAYSALVNGQTVCAGYARAFQYVLQQLEIPCYYCTGYAGQNHAWNIVSLDDGYYNVDTTWDDTGGGTYDYFNKTDGDYASSHIRKELSVYLPPCNGQAYRNLEPEDEESGEDGLRSLEDAGIAPEKVFADMPSYYEDCYDQIVQNGTGNYTFYNVLEGEDLLTDWYQNYQHGNYRQAYMEDALKEIGASSCELTLDVEELQGGRYLIMHMVSIR